VGDDVSVAEVAGWTQEFSQVEALLGPRFGRREPRARAVGYVRTLMAPLERKNGWTISEATGARSPHSVQWLLTGADWDPTCCARTCVPGSSRSSGIPVGC
jgi:hypothetical protein